MEDKICKRCVLSSSFPGARFNKEGLCYHCQTAPELEELHANRLELKAALDNAIADHRGSGSYDSIVALSGGKDSTYTLKRLVEDYDLRCLAVTIDNDFLADEARANCQVITSELGVDHILFKPNTKFMHNMYRVSVSGDRIHSPAALTRASSICNSCISLINAQMVRFAQQYNTGLIAGGYIGGQVPKDMAVLTVNPRKHDQIRKASIDRFTKAFGETTKTYFSYSSDDAKTPESVEIAVINPMLSYEISEEDIIKEIATLGWRRPQRTGITSTNCLLNDFGVYAHNKRHGHHPYALEIADQVRSGLMTREAGLKKVEAIPERDDVKDLAERLGMKNDEF